MTRKGVGVGPHATVTTLLGDLSTVDRRTSGVQAIVL